MENDANSSIPEQKAFYPPKIVFPFICVDVQSEDIYEKENQLNQDIVKGSKKRRKETQ